MPNMTAEERRQQLILAAARVISHHGVEGATTRAIAREAGAPQGIVHYAFGSRDELLTALMRWSTSATDDILDIEHVPGSGLNRAVSDLLNGYCAVDRSVVYAQFDLILWSMRSEGASTEAKQLYERLIALVGSLLKRRATEDEMHADFDYLARLVLIACDGMQFGLLCVGEDYVQADDVSDVAGALVALALQRGTGVRGAVAEGTRVASLREAKPPLRSRPRHRSA